MGIIIFLLSRLQMDIRIEAAAADLKNGMVVYDVLSYVDLRGSPQGLLLYVSSGFPTKS